MNKDLVSIIVPIYNAERYLSNCIESILNQSYKNLEILLINDGSTDKTMEICNSYAQKDNRIRVFNKINEGVSKTRNLGIKCATGNYIFFIDCDDFLEINAIEKLYEYTKEYEVIKINYLVFEKEKEKYRVEYKGEFSNIKIMKEIINGKIGGFCWGYLIKRELLNNILFDEETSYMEDTIFIIQVLLNTKKIKIVENTYYNHVIHGFSLTNTKNNILKTIKEYLYSLKKIEKIIKENTDYDCTLDILNKKAVIVEKEMTKIDNKDEFYQISEDMEIIDELNQILKEGIGIIKIYVKIILSRKYFIYKLYLIIRKLLKMIKNLL